LWDVEFQRVVQRRRMHRNFSERPVAREVVERILRNALHAPSAGFSQGWAFLVFHGVDEVTRFWEASWPPDQRRPDRRGVMAAPLVVVPLASKLAYLDRYAEPDKGWTDRDEARWPVPYWFIDTGFASLLMLLTVTDAGLGALFFGIGDAARVRDSFGIPADHDPIGAIAIGYPEPDEPSPSLRRGRRDLAEVVHVGRWGRVWS
jgi:nitroreductase